jgi:hypothetical protein
MMQDVKACTCCSLMGGEVCRLYNNLRNIFGGTVERHRADNMNCENALKVLNLWRSG